LGRPAPAAAACLVSPGLAGGGVKLFPRAWRCWCKPNGSQALSVWRRLVGGRELDVGGDRDRGGGPGPVAGALRRCATGRREGKIGCQRASAQAELSISMAGCWPCAKRRSCQGQQRQDGDGRCCSCVAGTGLAATSSPAPRLAWPAAWAWALAGGLELGPAGALLRPTSTAGWQPGEPRAPDSLGPTRASAFKLDPGRSTGRAGAAADRR